MTSSAHEHYERLLAEYYTRMFGDFESKVAAADAARLRELEEMVARLQQQLAEQQKS